MNIAGIILAAGSSSRMKKPKQLLEFDGKSFLQHAMDTAQNLSLTERIIVTGAHQEKVNQYIDHKKFKVLHNERFGEGMSSSLQVALHYLKDKKVDGALIMLCDQPLIPFAHYENLLMATQKHNALIIASEYEGTLGVPSIFKFSVFKDLLSLEGKQGAKTVIFKYEEKAVRITCAEAAYDIDTPEDYKLLMNGER